MEALHRVLANADANWDEGAEATMHARAKLDPFLWRLRAQAHDAASDEQEREESDPEMQVHRGASQSLSEAHGPVCHRFHGTPLC